MSKLIFISHKHSDRAIANVIRSFITEQSSGNIRVFQSSDAAARGPRTGRHLVSELRDALWEANAVILIYTTPDKDWGFCMWECGVATHPNSPDTRIIVIQCDEKAPDLFDGQVHVEARDKTSVKRFVTEFMTDPNFLPHATQPITGYEKSDRKVQLVADKLFDDLKAVMPEGTGAEWPTHPFIQLQLNSSSLKAITDAPIEQRSAVARSIILAGAEISDADKYAEALFGMAAFDPNLKLETLHAAWRAACPNASDAWLDGLSDQIGRAAQWQVPVLKWTPMLAVGDRGLHAPVLARVRKVPSISAMQFDVYFYPFNVLEATPVSTRMVRRPDMFCKVLEPDGEARIKVLELLRELDERRFARVPFVDAEDRLLYIAHRSMLDQFLTRQIRDGKVSGLDELTLADVLREQPEIKSIFRGTYAFVDFAATLGDAKLAMNKIRDCRDVFVTETGDAQGAVLGWVTDVIIATSEVE
jgi:TIR domain